MKTTPQIRFSEYKDQWTNTLYGDQVQLRRGLTYKPADVCSEGIRVLRSSNIDEDTFVTNADDVFVRREAVNIPFAMEGEILITSANGSPRLVGKHAVVSGISSDTSVPGGFMLIGHAEKADFINAAMGANWYRKFIDIYVSGGKGSIGNLKKSDLDIQEFAIPSDVEQRKIGEFFSKLDRLITLHQRKLDTLISVRKSMLQKMFPRKGNTVPVIRFSRFAEPWKNYKLGELYTQRNERGSDGLPILSVSIHTGVSSSELDADTIGKNVKRSEDKSLYKHVFVGDLVFNMMRAWQGAIGVVKSEGMVSPAYITAIPSEIVFPDFMDYALRRPDVISQINNLSYGVTDFRKRLYWDSFVQVECMLPSFQEQQLITKFFDCLSCDIALQEANLTKLRLLKKAFLSKLFP